MLRWIVAGGLVIGAAVIEFWPTGEAAYPFAASSVRAGEALQVEWRMLPAGLYPRPFLEGVVAGHTIAAGEPITPSDVRSPVEVPDGWWALAVEVPTALTPGAQTRLVLAEGPAVPGVVVAVDEPDAFDVAGPTALIAVPAEDATRVAAASAARQLVVLVAP